MIIILFGAPGVGKGTQATILAEKLNVAHLSTGDAFRSAIKRSTPVGQLAKGFVDAGALVPDDVVAKIVEEAMSADSFANGAILDGFPRTQGQADALNVLLQAKGLTIGKVVNIDVDNAAIAERLLLRGREDDTREVIDFRLSVYQKETEPLLQFYREMDKLVTVDGMGTVEEVNQRIIEAL